MMGRLIPSRSSSTFDPFAAEERENLRVVEAQAAVEKLEAAEKAWLRHAAPGVFQVHLRKIRKGNVKYIWGFLRLCVAFYFLPLWILSMLVCELQK